MDGGKVMAKVITCVTFRMLDEDGTIRHRTFRVGQSCPKADGTISILKGIIAGYVTGTWKEE